jgi:predicted acyltransferase
MSAVGRAEKDAAGPAQSTPVSRAHTRFLSLDAFRGLVMVFLVSDGFGFPEALMRFGEGAPTWVKFLGTEFNHAPWSGWTPWDLVHPAFIFAMGVAMSFSYASRAAKGDSESAMLWRAIRRALLLCFIGVFTAHKLFNFHFLDILTQIGLGYVFVYLLLRQSVSTRLIACAAIYVLYWCLFAVYPAPPPGFDYATVGVPANVPIFTGFLAHWNMNTNVGAAFDVWLLNLIPRSTPFLHGSGDQTIAFIPAICTVVFGTIVGDRLRRSNGKSIARDLLLIGALCVIVGLALGTVVPIIKRIWTPSYGILTTGVVVLLFALVYWVIELKRRTSWSFVFVVVGMNSLAMYCMYMILPKWYVSKPWRILLGNDAFLTPYGAVLMSAVVLITYWVVCFVLWRKRWFLSA